MNLNYNPWKIKFSSSSSLQDWRANSALHSYAFCNTKNDYEKSDHSSLVSKPSVIFCPISVQRRPSHSHKQAVQRRPIHSHKQAVQRRPIHSHKQAVQRRPSHSHKQAVQRRPSHSHKQAVQQKGLLPSGTDAAPIHH